jgi:hypothetical protein
VIKREMPLRAGEGRKGEQGDVFLGGGNYKVGFCDLHLVCVSLALTSEYLNQSL